MWQRDYSKCDVCGQGLGPDKLHVVIDNGHVTRHTYCCRRHRYIMVGLSAKQRGGYADTFPPQVQERSDLEIEGLASAFREGKLEVGWE